jgi:hypothetical protein
LKGINNLCHNIIKDCLQASNVSIPVTKPSAKRVAGWNDSVKSEKDQSLFWHWIWCECGKPNTGHVFNIMKRSRHQFHYAVRRAKINANMVKRKKLAENVSSSKSLWRELKSINPSNRINACIVDNATSPADIADLFVSKYRTLYNSVPTSMDELHGLSNEINNNINVHDWNRIKILPDSIKQCIKRLKVGKSDGNVNFYSDHLINSGNRLYVILSILFNAMLIHGHTPDDLLDSSIISIPKDRKSSLSNSNNYRGISLFNAICKIFDMLIIDLFRDELNTSDMQFGFKGKHSTNICTAIYIETVSHFVNNNSNVYSCLLDASKAFDRVNYGKLFRILIDKNLPYCIIRYIFDSYVRQRITVLWDNYKSAPFSVSNGVKQGGVLSPILFTMYIDKLLINLQKSGIGCCIDNIYVGALAYADDITLLCPSIRGLNKMLGICSQYASENDIIFNAKKTLCIKFGGLISNYEHVIFNNVEIAWCDTVKHLGNIINVNLTNIDDCRLKSSIFIGNVNKLISNFGIVQPFILSNLFKSYCSSMYGSQLWYFNTHCFNQFCIYWNKAIRRIFKLPNRTHTWILGPLMGQLHIREQLYLRSIGFLSQMYTCNNVLVQACIKRAKSNASTPLGYKFAFFRNAFGIDVNHENVNNCIKIVKNCCKLSDVNNAVVNNLNNLINVKNNNLHLEGFNIDEINELIDTIAIM